MDQQGYYNKYEVKRADGTPVEGRTFTLEIDNDPDAYEALASLALVYSVSRPQLAADLARMANALAGNQDAEKMPDWAVKATLEADLLQAKVDRLTQFGDTTDFANLPRAHRALLVAQSYAMEAVVRLIVARLAEPVSELDV